MAASPVTLVNDALADIGVRFDVRFTLPQPRTVERIPIGIPALDVLCAGGIPRGALTEIYGPPSSGRTSLLLALLARITASQEFGALIDTSDAFDPASAVEAGVHLSRLLWIRCGGNAEHALKVADLMVQAGGFGMIVMDLADTPPRTAARISLASWFRLRHAVERTPAALVVLAQTLNAKSCSALQLEMRPACQTPARWSGEQFGKLLRGMRIRAESRKYNQAQSAEFEVHANPG
jgi:recombination protein RecA